MIEIHRIGMIEGNLLFWGELRYGLQGTGVISLIRTRDKTKSDYGKDTKQQLTIHLIPELKSLTNM